MVGKDTTKALTIKLDVRNASTSPFMASTSVSGSDITAENSIGDTVNSSTGSATGEDMSFQKAGVVYTLIGTPTVAVDTNSNDASSTVTAVFKFNIAASGSDVTVASTGAFTVGIYVNNVLATTTVGSYSKPTTGVTGTSPYTIADGSNANFTVTGFLSKAVSATIGSGAVSARLESATTSAGTVTYISDTFRADTDGAGNSATISQ